MGRGIDQLCFEPPCLPHAESCMAFSPLASGSPAENGSKPNRKRQARDCSPNTNSTLNLHWLAMFYVDGFVDNDRLPPHHYRVMLHHYRVRLINDILGFR